MIAQDFYNAQYRILDHRVFVNGEIERFVNNFETKRNDSEVENLFKVTEIVGALKYDLSDKCMNLVGSAHLDNISKELKDILGKVENLVDVLQHPKEVSSEVKEARELRLQRKADFEKDLKHNYQRVEDSFAIKEEEISELYSDLQIKLNILK